MAHKQGIPTMRLATSGDPSPSERTFTNHGNSLESTTTTTTNDHLKQQQQQQQPNGPLWMRWVVLFFACWIMFGNYYAFDNPSALNSQLHPWLSGPDDPPGAFQYRLNLLYSIYSIPNVVLPLLVGQWMDRLGNQFFLLMLSLLSCLGQALFAYGVQQRFFWLALVGRLVFGLGGESLAVSQARIVTEWFAGKELALAIGLNLSIARVGLICNNNASPRIALRWGVPGALWVGLGSCLLSFLSTLIVVMIDKSGFGKCPAEDDDECEEEEVEEVEVEGGGEDLEQCRDYSCEEEDNTEGGADGGILSSASTTTTTTKPILILTKHKAKRRRSSRPSIHPVFWLLVAMCFLFYSAMIPYNNVASDYLQARYYPGDPLSANLAMSLPDMLAMFLVPLMGIWVDRSGRKLVTLVLGSIAFIVGHFGLAVGFGASADGSLGDAGGKAGGGGLAAGAGGLVPLTILGVAYSTMLTFWACVPKLARTRRHQRAYGTLTSAMNLSVTLVPLLVAYLINLDPSYRQVGLFFSSLGLVALVLAGVLIVLNRRFSLHLNRRVQVPVPIILDASMLPALATIEEHQEYYYYHHQHHHHHHHRCDEDEDEQNGDGSDLEAIATSSSSHAAPMRSDEALLHTDLTLVNSSSDCSSVVL